jgi:hypothetical protein
MKPHPPTTAQLASLLPTLPSEAVLLDLLIGSPQLFGLSADQLVALRSIRLAFHETVIDATASLQKAEIDRGDDAASGARLSAAFNDAVTRVANVRAKTYVDIRHLITAKQFAEATECLRANDSNGSIAVAGLPEPAGARDQKVVEIETAALVTERVLSWAKLFAAAVAVPAALLIAVLTVIGISKFSDFTTLVTESETKLQASVASATTNADLLAQKVVDLTQQQTESARRLEVVTEQLSSVREKLGFAPGTSVAPAAQKELQERFDKFQAFVVGLGYTPGEREIKVAIADDAPSAYYKDNTIYVPKGWVNDSQVIYREYLHHVLYSKVGLEKVGPQRSVLESGVADYLVASYSGSARLYAISLGTPVNLEATTTIRPARGHEDRFPVGQSWAALFWQIRQTIGRGPTDRAVAGAWFELENTMSDQSLSLELTTRFLARAAGTDASTKAAIVGLLKQRGAPVP